MFDEQPDSDPHDECSAEIKRLTLELMQARALLRKCVTVGYSRHEINSFLSAQTPLSDSADATQPLDPGDRSDAFRND